MRECGFSINPQRKWKNRIYVYERVWWQTKQASGHNSGKQKAHHRISADVTEVNLKSLLSDQTSMEPTSRRMTGPPCS